jgi:hypothetical protein
MASVSVRRGGSVGDVTAALGDSSGGVIPIASEFLLCFAARVLAEHGVGLRL